VFKKADVMFGQRESYKTVKKKKKERENQNAINVRQGAELDRARETKKKGDKFVKSASD
jgi:hypothetical protein